MATHEERVRLDIRQEFENTLEQRVQRFLEIAHQGVIAGEHFGPASAECLRLYRDGHFISAVMVSQAVAEALFRFVLERNTLRLENDRPAVAPILVERGILSQTAADAFVRIWRSFRGDVHHLNPKVTTEIPFPELAKRNVTDLAMVERELFEVAFDNGRILPKQPKYWDLRPDGTAAVYLRDWWIE
jgi:hypothetical protein